MQDKSICFSALSMHEYDVSWIQRIIVKGFFFSRVGFFLKMNCEFSFLFLKKFFHRRHNKNIWAKSFFLLEKLVETKTNEIV